MSKTVARKLRFRDSLPYLLSESVTLAGWCHRISDVTTRNKASRNRTGMKFTPIAVLVMSSLAAFAQSASAQAGAEGRMNFLRDARASTSGPQFEFSRLQYGPLPISGSRVASTAGPLQAAERVTPRPRINWARCICMVRACRRMPPRLCNGSARPPRKTMWVRKQPGRPVCQRSGCATELPRSGPVVCACCPAGQCRGAVQPVPPLSGRSGRAPELWHGCPVAGKPRRKAM